MKSLILHCLAACGIVCAGLSAEPVKALRVMSFNIWVNGGHSLSNCVEAIRRSGADLVGLQECQAEPAREIATRLGYHVLATNGCSIVSRYPLVALGSAGGGQGVTVRLGPDQQVHFFNCHLAPYPYGPYSLKEGRAREFILDQEHQTRMPALKGLLAFMKPWLDRREPCFLAGDFNAPSHHDYQDFPWPTSIACIKAGLSDAYFDQHPNQRKYPGPFRFDEPGITWTPIPKEEPEGVFDRIDFVYFSNGDGLTVKEAAVLDGRNSVDPWPSDHRAVLITFELGPVPTAGRVPETRPGP